MNLNEVLIDKKNQMSVDEISAKHTLSSEICYATMWCLDKYRYSENEIKQIRKKFAKLTTGMKSYEIERIMNGE